LFVNVETNLLSLVSPWSDKFYQITTKDAIVTFHPLFLDTLSIVFFVFWISGPSIAEGDETKHKAAGRRQPGRLASQLDRAFCAMEDFEDCELSAAFWKR
jgi:hypothetical protein